MKTAVIIAVGLLVIAAVGRCDFQEKMEELLNRANEVSISALLATHYFYSYLKYWAVT